MKDFFKLHILSLPCLLRKVKSSSKGRKEGLLLFIQPRNQATVQGCNVQNDDMSFLSAGSVGSLASAEAVELQHMKVGNLQIKSAEYCSSSVKLAQCPAPTQPEIAIIGRSNVGKSSLINMLTGRKELALVSKTPGKVFSFLLKN